jgi:hypothetical protein
MVIGSLCRWKTATEALLLRGPVHLRKWRRDEDEEDHVASCSWWRWQLASLLRLWLLKGQSLGIQDWRVSSMRGRMAGICSH